MSDAKVIKIYLNLNSMSALCQARYFLYGYSFENYCELIALDSS